MKYIKLVLLSYLFIPTFSLAEKRPLLINGAGATFPYILYSKWFNEYTKVDTSVRINYRSIGSGGGIRQMLKGTLDFGASDIPMTAEDLKKSQKPVIHIPTTLSAVVITYNLPEIKDQILRLDSQLLKNIFDGSIQKWNNPLIQKLNPKLALPDQDIIVVYRSDGSGTTAVFTEYLSQTQPQWLEKYGKGKSINWPVGIGGKGNEGMMALIRKTKGALGYVGMGYSFNRKLPVAAIQNKSGNFIYPSFESVQKSAEYVVSQNNNYTDTIVNASEKTGYPLSAFSFILLYAELPHQKGQVMIDFLHWALTDGQSFSKKLYYVPLPENVIQQAKTHIKKIQLLKPHESS